MKKFRDMALFLLVILSFSIIVICGTYNYNLSPVNHNDDIKKVTIKKGKDINAVADLLYEKHLIRNPKVFKIYLTIYKIKEFKAGVYKLRSSMSAKEIVDTLLNK